MKIEVLICDDNYYSREKLIVDGEEVMEAHDLSDCPEDAILGRNINSMSSVAELMEFAYQAGKRGESFSLEYKELSEEEYYG